MANRAGAQGSDERGGAGRRIQFRARLGLLCAALAITTIVAAVNGGEDRVTVPTLGPHHVADWTTWAGKDLQRSNEDLELAIKLVFKVRNKADRDKFLSELEDPKSPNYHHWLTPAERQARWGPTPGEVKALSNWCSSQGFKVLGADLFELTVIGTVGMAEKAFATTIVYSPVFHNAVQYANKTDPQIPARFAPVVETIKGLDDTKTAVPIGPEYWPKYDAPPPQAAEPQPDSPPTASTEPTPPADETPQESHS